jgi:hypothetical protein
MKILGVEGMSEEAMQMELSRGAKLVRYEYCISVLVMTFKRSSDIYFIKAGESALVKGLLFSLLTFFLGWWGIPWGPIYSIGALITNFKGGHDVTALLMKPA